MATDTSVQQTEPQGAERTRGGRVYRPHVDILETREELTLVADVPGVKSDGVDIDFENGVLTIQGKVEPRYGEKINFLLAEYGIGDFYRTFRVSEQIDVARIHAVCADGVLVVHLPKAESAKPRKIAVKAAS
jgi:HSP20 family molecular chaperone IbpA